MAMINETLTADGDSDIISWPGGVAEFQAQGDFGTGTAKVQWRMNSDQSWTDVSGASLTSDGRASFDIGPCTLKVNLAGSSNPDLDIRVAKRSTIYG